MNKYKVKKFRLLAVMIMFGIFISLIGLVGIIALPTLIITEGADLEIFSTILGVIFWILAITFMSIGLYFTYNDYEIIRQVEKLEKGKEENESRN